MKEGLLPTHLTNGTAALMLAVFTTTCIDSNAMEGCLASGGAAVYKVYEDENGTRWNSYNCESKDPDED